MYPFQMAVWVIFGPKKPIELPPRSRGERVEIETPLGKNLPGVPPAWSVARRTPKERE